MRCFSRVLSVVMVLSAILLPPLAATVAKAEIKSGLKPTIIPSTRNGDSKPVRQMTTVRPKKIQTEPRELPIHRLPKGDPSERLAPLSLSADPVLQDIPGAGAIPSTIVNFEGVDNQDRVLPPDTTGDVSSDHYVQWVNMSFSIFDKEGQKITGPTPGNELWESLGSKSACAENNHGDPIVLYDQISGRWIITDFAFSSVSKPPY